MRWSREEGGTPVAVTCRDVSLGGCFLETTEPPPIGTTILVYLDLPHAEPATRPPSPPVRSTVRWSTSRGMGVQLGTMGGHATAELVAFLASVAPSDPTASRRTPRRAAEEQPGFLHDARFPRSNAYHPQWALDADLQAHPLWLCEWLVGRMGLRPGMRVLDLGSTGGRAAIFLARELGVEAWAADPTADPSDNRRRAEDAGCADRVVPIRVDPKRLPFAAGFFDAAVCLDVADSVALSDTDPTALATLVKPGGELAIASAGLTCDLRMTIPAHVARFVGDGARGLQLVDRWRSRLVRAGVVEPVESGRIEDGCPSWLAWAEATHRTDAYLHTLRAYGPRYLGYFGLVVRRSSEGMKGAPTSTGEAATRPAEAVPPPLLRATPRDVAA